MTCPIDCRDYEFTGQCEHKAQPSDWEKRYVEWCEANLNDGESLKAGSSTIDLEWAVATIRHFIAAELQAQKDAIVKKLEEEMKKAHAIRFPGEAQAYRQGILDAISRILSL